MKLNIGKLGILCGLVILTASCATDSRIYKDVGSREFQEVYYGRKDKDVVRETLVGQKKKVYLMDHFDHSSGAWTYEFTYRTPAAELPATFPVPR